MARHPATHILVLSALAVAGGYAANKGWLGSQAQAAVAPLITSVQTARTPPSYTGCQPPYGNLNAMLSANPSVKGQFYEWQRGERYAGHNAIDWPAFRAHQATFGYPDPGDRAPQEFCMSEASGYIPGSVHYQSVQG